MDVTYKSFKSGDELMFDTASWDDSVIDVFYGESGMLYPRPNKKEEEKKMKIYVQPDHFVSGELKKLEKVLKKAFGAVGIVEIGNSIAMHLNFVADLKERHSATNESAVELQDLKQSLKHVKKVLAED